MRSKYVGCFLGLAIGDAYGAPYEGGVLERFVWKLICKTKTGKLRYTDDTQMAIDIATSYIQCGEINQDRLAYTFAKSYTWSRGYGPAAAAVLKKIKNGAPWREVNRSKYKEGSFGNGAAMRAPILSLCYPHDNKKLIQSVEQCSEITHAHPLAIEGAKIIAETTKNFLLSNSLNKIFIRALALAESKIYEDKLKYCMDVVGSDKTIETKDIRVNLGNEMAAVDSSITSIYYATKYLNDEYDLMHRNICKLGGDVDTICAMAGAIWGAANGVDALQEDKIENLEDSEIIINIANDLYNITECSEKI